MAFFFCCAKSYWKKVKFDENIGGFHGYDIDFSLGVNRIAKVIVVYDILLEHLSSGNYNKAWVNSLYLLHQKWKWELPVNYTTASKSEIISLELGSREQFIRSMKDFGFRPREVLRTIWGLASFRFFNWKKFFRWNREWLFYARKYQNKLPADGSKRLKTI